MRPRKRLQGTAIPAWTWAFVAWLGSKIFRQSKGIVVNTLQRDFSPNQFTIRFHIRILINQFTREKIIYVEKLCYIAKYFQYFFAQKYEECKQDHEKLLFMFSAAVRYFLFRVTFFLIRHSNLAWCWGRQQLKRSDDVSFWISWLNVNTIHDSLSQSRCLGHIAQIEPVKIRVTIIYSRIWFRFLIFHIVLPWRTVKTIFLHWT